MYCSRSTGILAPSAMSRRRWSASWGILPACFDTRSSSAFSWGMASPRRLFSPAWVSYSWESWPSILRMFSRLLSQGNPQQLQIAAGAGQHLVEDLQPGGHGGAARLDVALLLLRLARSVHGSGSSGRRRRP